MAHNHLGHTFEQGEIVVKVLEKWENSRLFYRSVKTQSFDRSNANVGSKLVWF